MDGKGLKRFCEVLIGLFLAGAAFLYILCGENSHIAVHDNLDLFVARYPDAAGAGVRFSLRERLPCSLGAFRGTSCHRRGP